MPDSNPLYSECASLIALMLSNRLEDADRARLNELCREHEECRKLYLENMSVHAMLLWSMGGADQRNENEFPLMSEMMEQAMENRRLSAQVARVEEQAPASGLHVLSLTLAEEDAPPKRIIVIPWAVVWTAVAALVLVTTWIGLSLFDRRSTGSSIAGVEPAPLEYVAEVIDHRDAVWAETLEDSNNTTRLIAGTYTLLSGAAEVRLEQGASLILQAPCKIEILNKNHTRLLEGRLVANVAHEATGFIVEVNGTRFIDIGTQFGVDISKAGDVLMEVLEGEVVLKPADLNLPSASLKAGYMAIGTTAGQYQAVGTLTSLDRKPLFARSLDDAAISAEERYAQQVIEDKPVAYWRFDDLAPDKTVANAVEPGVNDLMGYGYFLPGPGAVGSAVFLDNRSRSSNYFQSKDLLEPLAGADSFTMELWYRIDKPQFAKLFALHAAGVYDQKPNSSNAANIQLIDDTKFAIEGWKTNRIRGLFRDPPGSSSREGTNVFASENYLIDRWQHVVFCKDKNELRLYIDGLLTSKTDAKEGALPDQVVAVMGIGDLSSDNSSKSNMVRALTGWLDEVAIYNHALTDKQIADHYRIAQDIKD